MYSNPATVTVPESATVLTAPRACMRSLVGRMFSRSHMRKPRAYQRRRTRRLMAAAIETVLSDNKAVYGAPVSQSMGKPEVTTY